MFTERLSELLKISGLKNTELAQRLGVSKSAVSKWLSGEAEPRPDALRAMAKIFNVTAGYLINDEPPTGISGESETRAETFPSMVFTQEEPEPLEGLIWLPVFETAISATPGVQDIVRDDVLGWHTAPESLAGSSGNDPYLRPFSMKVKGDSMLPLIRPGDYLTVRPAPFIVPDLNCVYAVKINDDLTDTYGVVVKRVQADNRRGIYLLRSDNPEFPVYIVESEKASIIGKIINLWRPM